MDDPFLDNEDDEKAVDKLAIHLKAKYPELAAQMVEERLGK